MSSEEGIPGLFTILANGSVARSDYFTPSVPARNSDPGCLSRDVLLDIESGLRVRLFLPTSQKQQQLLPLVVYIHGGGFCMCRSSTAFIHDFCVELAKAAQALVVSVDYRLAPEHRLPAAYDDCAQVLQWLKRHESSDVPAPDPWISNFADSSRCFLMGESSGANILHQLMLRGKGELLRMEGLILVHPFFGGEKRTASEIMFASDDLMLPVDLCDELWRHCLPVGATRDHPFCNPFSKDLSKVRFPRILLVVGGKNSLQDRQVDYFNLLKDAGKDVQLLYVKNAVHAFEFAPAQSYQASIMLEAIVDFVADV